MDGLGVGNDTPEGRLVRGMLLLAELRCYRPGVRCSAAGRARLRRLPRLCSLRISHYYIRGQLMDIDGCLLCRYVAMQRLPTTLPLVRTSPLIKKDISISICLHPILMQTPRAPKTSPTPVKDVRPLDIDVIIMSNRRHLSPQTEVTST